MRQKKFVKFQSNFKVSHYFSGFKEPSETSHPLTVISVLSSNAEELIESQKNSCRSSKRRKVEVDPVQFADEEILKIFLIKKRFVRAREDIRRTMLQWKPKIELSRLSPYEIFRLSDNWRFLECLNITDTIEFRCEILAQQKQALHSRQQQVLVRWFPSGIIEDSWVDRTSLPRHGIVNIKVQNLSWKQKLLVRDKLFRMWSDQKTQMPIVKRPKGRQ